MPFRSTKQTIWDLRFVLIHIIVFISGYLILGFFGHLHQVPGTENMQQWDSSWYASIKDNGYLYDPNAPSNIAFFPLFPYFWRITSLGPFGIGVLNGLIFLTSFSLLARTYKFDVKESLLFLSLPSMFFFYLPYTESLFFLMMTIMFIGLHKQKQWLIILGLFLSSMIRPTSIFFIPAIIFMEFLYTKWKGKELRQTIFRTSLYIIASISSILIVLLIQRYQTGEWFGYFEAQIKHWKHEFLIPEFPLTTWGRSNLIWLDATALFFGLVALFGVFFIGIRWIRNKFSLHEKYDKGLLFSITYLGVMAVYAVFFNETDAKGGTSVMSLNRYIFATPFIILFLWFYMNKVTFSLKVFGVYMGIFILVALLFGAYTNLEDLQHFKLEKFKTASYFGIMGLYVGIYGLLNHPKFKSDLILPLYCLNMLLQLVLLDSFLSGNWVG